VRITGIKVQLVEYDRPYFHWCDDLPVPPTHVTAPFLRILTDEGIEGHCFGAIDVVDAGINAVNGLLVGEDPLNRERIWHRFWKASRWRGFQGRLGTVDIALWDLVGKMTGQPVYKLLGGFRDEIPAYASTLTLDSVEEYADLARDCVERGYSAIKLHIWGKARRDLQACQAVREAVGDEIVLMLDASSMHTLEEATWFGRALEEMNYYFYEEPIDHFNLTGLVELRKRLRIPLAVAETTNGSVYDAATHLKMGTGDIVITDPLFKAGFTGSMKTANLWEAYGLRCKVHGSDIACLHTALAIPSNPYFESWVPEGIMQVPGIRTAATEVGRDGLVRAWPKPGLGMEIDWAWIDAHTTRTLE
jgi:L-alanine-DL-glutamate epimerase-like enolase superfamily enzyme